MNMSTPFLHLLLAVNLLNKPLTHFMMSYDGIQIESLLLVYVCMNAISLCCRDFSVDEALM